MLKGDKGWRKAVLKSTGGVLDYHLEIKRIKKIYVRVKPEGVFVTAPVGTALYEIEECLNYDAQDILRAQAKLDKKLEAAKKQKQSLKHNQELEFLGGLLPFKCMQGKSSKAVFADDGLVFYMQDVNDNEELQRLIDKFYTDQCKKLFPVLLKEQYRNFLNYYNIPIPSLKIRDMKTRWGTCNILTADVTLNKKLIRAPKKVIEMIIIHELSHLIERNHNARFYGVMTRVMPEWKIYEDHLEKTSDGWFLE